MALARFKDLCIDVVDTDRMSRFWADALGLRIDGAGTPNPRLIGTEPEQTVWINQVDEPVTVKQRVHLDVHGPRGRTYAGASVPEQPADVGWTVLLDPEGGELCLFERDEPPAYALYEIVVDSVDSGRIAAWWAEVLGATSGAEHGFHWVEDVPGLPFECLVFGPVPEPKTVKNRIHWDVEVADESDVDALVAAGATLVRAEDDDIDWTVLADPEGNEFCVFVHD